MKTSATSGSVAYDTAVDAAYTVYNATLKDYPVANAFVDGANTSQVKWGLQIAARATQNTAWKAQLTYGVASGTGALAPYSITYGFARTISKLEAGNIQTMFYQNGFPTVHFDETLNSISTVRNGGTTANTAITTGTQNVK